MPRSLVPTHLFRVAAATVAVLGATALLAGCAGGGADDAGAGELRVLGAASTRVINEDLADMAGDLDPAQELAFINAGSSTLVQQLADGSPGDLLITADQASMDTAVENGSARDPRVVATNSMVMVVPAGNPAGVTGVDSSLTDASVVLCDPQVPCGAVSEAIMADLDATINPVSLEHSVSDALGKVVSGEADAGWVYRTDAVAAGDAVEVMDIPGAEDHPNSLVAAVTTGTENPAEAEILLALLGSGEMARAWEEHGFTPVT